MNKNIDFEQVQYKINDFNELKRILISDIQRKNEEIKQIDIEIGWLTRDNCNHQLIKSQELVHTEENCGEVIMKEEWCCTQCLYREHREVE